MQCEKLITIIEGDYFTFPHTQSCSRIMETFFKKCQRIKALFFWSGGSRYVEL